MGCSKHYARARHASIGTAHDSTWNFELVSALAARRLFEASVGELPKIPKDFNAYGFSVLAERAYGSVKRSVDVNMNGKLPLKQVVPRQIVVRPQNE